MPPPRLPLQARSRLLILLLFAATAAAAGVAVTAAHARPQPSVRWLVPADGDLEAWRVAAEITWPDGLAVRAWDGRWPPQAVDLGFFEGTVAHLEGSPQEGTLVIQSGGEGNTTRLPLRFPDADDEEARRSVLLILRSSVVPLTVENATPDPILLPPPEDVEAAAAEVETLIPRGRLRGGLSAGVSYRPGLSNPSFAPRGRLAVVLGKKETSPLRLWLTGGAELGGRATIGGVEAREDEGFVALGLEVRIPWRRTQIPLAVAIGPRYYRGIRTDRSDALPDQGWRPTLVFGGGPSWALTDGLRLEARLTGSVELVRGEDGGPALGMELTAGDRMVFLEMFPLRIGLEVAVDFGEPRTRPGSPEKKSNPTAVRPPVAATPNGAEG